MQLVPEVAQVAHWEAQGSQVQVAILGQVPPGHELRHCPLVRKVPGGQDVQWNWSGREQDKQEAWHSWMQTTPETM